MPARLRNEDPLVPVTSVTRRALYSALRGSRYDFHGELDEVTFLTRLYPLDTMPAYDTRETSMEEDIRRHRVANPGDWPDDWWVLEDKRLELNSDENLLRFLEEMVSPEVRADRSEVTELVLLINRELAGDGYALIEVAKISGRPVYKARVTEDGSTKEPWAGAVIQSVCDVLGDTDTGLTGFEIGKLIERLNLPDPEPSASKRHRIYKSLFAQQQSTTSSDSIIAFVEEAMAPVSYTTRRLSFETRRAQLNLALAFVGLHVNDSGRVVKGEYSSTVDEAHRAANSVILELRRRETHEVVLSACEQTVLEGNLFHALFEAAKTLPARLREITKSQKDGAALIDQVTALGASGIPIVQVVDEVDSQSGRDAQRGFHELCKGALWMFRNPSAHDSRSSQQMPDIEFIESVGVLSLIHRYLDSARVNSD